MLFAKILQGITNKELLIIALSPKTVCLAISLKKAGGESVKVLARGGWFGWDVCVFKIYYFRD